MRNRLAMLGLIVLLLFGGGLVVGLWLRGGAAPAPRPYNTAVVLQQVQTLSQLVTVKYVMEKVMALDVPPDSTLSRLFAGENRILMVAHGNVKAGLDLSKLQPRDIQVVRKKIFIKLPPAQILDAYLDEKQTRVVERTTGFLRTFDKDLEQTVRQNAVEDISRAARTSGILKDADERARTQLKGFFTQLGFEEVEFIR